MLWQFINCWFLKNYNFAIFTVDVRLPGTSEMFLQNALLIFFSIGIISSVVPWFLIALVPLILCFLALNVVFTSGVSLLQINRIRFWYRSEVTLQGQMWQIFLLPLLQTITLFFLWLNFNSAQKWLLSKTFWGVRAKKV